MAHRDQPSGPVQSIDRAFDILEKVGELENAGVTELAQELDLPKSTIHNQLKTLEKQGYLINNNGDYELGLKLLFLGETARKKKEGYILIESKVKELAERTGERAQFLVEEQLHAIHIYTKIGKNGIDTGADVGTRRQDLHATAAGKVILSNISEDRVEEFFSTVDLKNITDNTIVDKSKLKKEIKKTRQRGYSFNDEESISGFRAVGVPIQHPNGEFYGALSVSGPTHRMKNEKYESEIPDLLLGISNEIELNMLQI
ncbi:IclR family transcriptional regulator [Natrialbaceae archaeon AArc-T1-2]|uniref:IclR family transcriptional regulator n=1 Tax=Natrialbaceae archaeon AArc-T1-2 TaxID=3053904 RepID=UPI00255ADE82|nr:IclR family transcriptional regulator [Natrialbaceae archaeon AArc-T1-2]WIV68740.1 IclR family transcriptional regulator [Natrialbaceae archaeon AArc-T1-2]